VGWDDTQQQQQQQQQTLRQHRPPLAVLGSLFDHSTSMQIELRQVLQKDVYERAITALFAPFSPLTLPLISQFIFSTRALRYKRFAQAAGCKWVALFFATVVVAQGVKTASDFYLATWTASSRTSSSSSSSASTAYFIKAYTALTIVNAAMLLLRGIAAAAVLNRASQVLHARLTTGVFYSPMAVIVRTSVGVMLNRLLRCQFRTARSLCTPWLNVPQVQPRFRRA
jgi:hypothetical protein